MGSSAAAAGVRAPHVKPRWRAAADPVGQPLRQNHECLNRFFIQLFIVQENPHWIVGGSLVVGRP